MPKLPLIVPGVLATALMASCAAAPDAAQGARTSDLSLTCRELALPGRPGTDRVCALEEEWEDAIRTGALNSDVRCRERLRVASNTHLALCATEAAWTRVTEWEGKAAEHQVLRLQGFSFGTPF